MKYRQLSDLTYEIVFDSEKERNSFLDNKWMKASDVMKALNISRVTLCNYVKRGLIETYQPFPNSKYLYGRASVMRLRGE
jgi:hypothetical protein